MRLQRVESVQAYLTSLQRSQELGILLLGLLKRLEQAVARLHLQSYLEHVTNADGRIAAFEGAYRDAIEWTKRSVCSCIQIWQGPRCYENQPQSSTPVRMEELVRPFEHGSALLGMSQ